MSRRSRDTQNQRRGIRISRRDVPEKGKIDVATLKRRDVVTSRRDREGFKQKILHIK